MNGYQKSIQILKEREKKKRQGAKYGEEHKDEIEDRWYQQV